jgi:hypothetical protein
MTLQEDIAGLTDRIKSEYDSIYASERYIRQLKAERNTLVKEQKKRKVRS